MGQRVAFIVGYSQYEDPHLSRFPSPPSDVTKLAAVLRNASIGAFDEVITLINEPGRALRHMLTQFYSGKGTDDELLLYFSGHTLLDEHRHLYLAVTDTNYQYLDDTAFAVASIMKSVEQSPSQWHTILLDCYHSMLAQAGAEASVGMPAMNAATFAVSGQQLAVLTSTDAVQYVWMNDRVEGVAERSVFTHHLTHGMQSGAADVDHDGLITLEDLYTYTSAQAARQVTMLKPARWRFGQEHDVVLVRVVHPQVEQVNLPTRARATIAQGTPTSLIIGREADAPRSANGSEQESKEVFFSYKRDDASFVQKVYEDLAIRSVKPIWMDQNALAPGDEFKSIIARAIAQCSHMVVFVSYLSLQSEEVRAEFELADHLGKVIIPLIIDSSFTVDNLPPILHKHQVLTLFPNDSYISQLAHLVKRLPQYGCSIPSMVPIQGGPFVMGQPGEEYTVDLPTYWIATTAVTVNDFAHFVQAGGLARAVYWPEGTTGAWLNTYPHSQYWPSPNLSDQALRHPRQPMHGLTFAQASAYGEWLNYVVGQPGLYCLPTEAQWEKAARGTDGRSYPWGNIWLPDLANTREHGQGAPIDVGMLSSAGDSPYGCQDMAGNVWEWTRSRPLPPPYVNNGTREETLRPSSEPRVIRGGSWVSLRSDARTYSRASESPTPQLYRHEIGMRLIAVRDPAVI